MGLPVIEVDFKQLAASAVKRSTRGTVALLLEDDTALTAYAAYKNEGDIPASGTWSADSKKLIKMALWSGAAKVLAVRVTQCGSPAAYDYAGALDGISGLEWNWAAAPNAAAAGIAATAQWIKTKRAAQKTFKAVLAGAADADSAGIVSLATGGITSDFLGAGQSYTAGEYTARIAGLLAGMPLDRSATGYVLRDVTAADASADPGGDVDDGKLVIVRSGDSFEIARGVTTLQTAATSLFKKIKHVEGADMIRDDIVRIWKGNYLGKRVNSYAGKQSLCAEIKAYLSGLTGSVLDGEAEPSCMVDAEKQRAYLAAAGADVAAMDEAELLRANTGENVYLKIEVTLADAMEDVYIGVSLN